MAAWSKASRFGSWFCVVAILSGYVFLGRDGRHHWHEWRYLYSASNYSVKELVSGQFDAGPPPERSREEVGAWYWGQIFHELILAGLVRFSGQGTGALRVIEWTYGLMVVLAVLGAQLALRRLRLGQAPLLFGGIALISPLGTYLGFKLMAEVPAVLFAAASLWLMSVVLTARIPAVRLACVVGAGAAAALSFLSMVYMPLMILGFWAALLGVMGKELGYARLLVYIGLATLSATLSGAVILCFYGLDLADYVVMYQFFRAYKRPFAVSLFGVGMAGSLLYGLLPAAFFSKKVKQRTFCLVWLFFSVLPVLLFGSNYIEPRFLIVGFIPLASLVALSVEVLTCRLPNLMAPTLSRTACMTLALVLTGSVSYLSLPLMPFEMNSEELLQTAQGIWKREPEAQILLPWNYTDYHFLRFAFPDKPVYLVQAPVTGSGEVVDDPAWRERQRQNYGARYISESRELARLLRRPIYYVGHGTLPPFKNLQALANLLGLTFVSQQIEAIKPMNHLAQSWMWNNKMFTFSLVSVVGEYRAYRVNPIVENGGDLRLKN